MPDSPTPLLISVHIPKSGGTSFGATLSAHFGARLLLQYQRETRTTNKRRSALFLAKALGRGFADALRYEKFRGVDCIHGHFPAIRFLPLSLRRQVTVICWLREPVERLVSHYHHIYRMQPRAPAPPPIWDRIVGEQWSFERFAMCDRFRNQQSLFLRWVPLRLFSFVGITEHFEEDHVWLARNILKTKLTTMHLNTNPEKAEARYPLDPELRRRIERYHAADTTLYARAVSLRRRRRS